MTSYRTDRFTMPPTITCDNCHLTYYQTSAAHVCAEWGKGETMKATTDTMNRHDNDKPIRKVEGVILTRSQCGWQVEKLPIHGCRIVDNTGRIVAADVYDEALAEQIVDEHNQILTQKREAQHGLR